MDCPVKTPVGLGKGARRGQASRKADDAGAFGDLERLADQVAVHLVSAARQGPVGVMVSISQPLSFFC